MKTKNKTLAASLAASLAALAAVLRFALRGYDVVALILLVAAALVVLWAFVGGLAFKVALGPSMPPTSSSATQAGFLASHTCLP